jgi:hypothetical protein
VESVFVKAAGARGVQKRFVKVSASACADIAGLARRISVAFPTWRVAAEDIVLFLVRVDRTRTVELGDDECEGAALVSGDTLAAAGVANGAFLLARLPDLPAPTSSESLQPPSSSLRLPYGGGSNAAASAGSGGYSASSQWSLIESLAIAMSFPAVDARVWLSTSGVSVKLLPSYSSFFFAVINSLLVGPAARLFWFVDERCPISERRPLRDEATFSLFRDAWRGGLRPIVWAYTPASAEALRLQDQLPAAALGLPKPVTPATSTPSAGARESGLQREFRSSLEARDGKNSCVACQKAGPAEAAHILRQHSSRSLHVPAGLLSAWDIRNGIMLCSVCRLYFDKFFWCVGADGKIVVSEALLSDGELCGHFAPLVDNKLRHAAGDVNWPCDLTWAHHRLLFEAARDELSRLNACSKFACADCGAIFPSSHLWQHHVEVKAACSERRICKGRAHLWTRAERRAFPAIALADEAALAARQQLSLLGEGEVTENAEDERSDDSDEESGTDSSCD